MAKRWASMKDLFSKYPLAVNVAIVAGFDDPLLRAFGEPSQPSAPATKSNAGEDGPDWLFEDQTRTKVRP